MPTGQLYVQIPHWTQRAESGTTCAEARTVCLFESRLKISKIDILNKSTEKKNSYGLNQIIDTRKSKFLRLLMEFLLPEGIIIRGKGIKTELPCGNSVEFAKL